MLSSTLRCGNRLNDWNTMPIRGPDLVGVQIADPRVGDVPTLQGDHSVVDDLEQVDAAQQGRLPDPDAPISATHWCSPTDQATSRSTTLSP